MNEYRQSFFEKRDELQKRLAKRRGELEQAVAEKEHGVIAAKREANERGSMQDRDGAHYATRRAGQLSEEIRAAKAEIREIDLELALVFSGNHHELHPLIHRDASAVGTANTNELEAARAAFQALLTPELKSAAQRFVTAAKNAFPLMPAPTLAEMLSVTETGAAQGGAV
ncbi:hypothetical protein HCX48_09510 [Rhodocyclus tenuis]|uniref:Uncharacterized protein n=2 Tax=Rhodocyclus TaxID=1064 RepID=A0A6L5JZ56_RHOTE|nr:hypothetical protein [Rhodocyclus gracilis]MQY52112.1 hypothetical protein [Rhodocyclus gracilis]NJA89456.1 hypothetical protein [Rhodocyclus gracilis]